MGRRGKGESNPESTPSGKSSGLYSGEARLKSATSYQQTARQSGVHAERLFQWIPSREYLVVLSLQSMRGQELRPQAQLKMATALYSKRKRRVLWLEPCMPSGARAHYLQSSYASSQYAPQTGRRSGCWSCEPTRKVS